MEGQQQIGDLLTHYEAEHLIEKLYIINIEEYGSNQWFKQDEVFQRLNMQAHVNAMVKSDEFIMESLVTFDKVKTLIYDLIQTEIWKQKVLPILKDHMLQINTYRSYIAVYHEAVICNLLEVVMFHRTAVDSAEEFLVELIDYCYRKLVHLTKFPQTKKVTKKTVEDVLKRTRLEEYQEQIDEIEFKICMMCVSIIRFISDYVRHLPVSVVHHLIDVTDILCLLVPLIEDKPWLRQTSTGEREKFENSKWVIVEKNEYSKIVKLEANVWITIYNLFMDPECRKKYELSEFRKSNMLRVRIKAPNIYNLIYLSQILVKKIPNLSHMLRTLEELSIMQVQSVPKGNPFIVQQVPEIRDKISKGKNWNEIAQKQKTEYFINDKETAKQDMQRLADLYGQNIIDGLMEGFKCELCKKDASKRCSSCKNVWYCTRECQVRNQIQNLHTNYPFNKYNQLFYEQIAHWKDHKVQCKNLVEENKEKEQRKKNMISQIDKENIQDNNENQSTQSKVLVQEVEEKKEKKEQKIQQVEIQQKNQNLDELD